MTARSAPISRHVNRIITVLRRISSEGEASHLTFADLIAAMGPQAHRLLILMLTLLNMIPGPPGFGGTIAWTTFAVALAMALIVVWVVTGPLFGFSDTWQLVINTGTTIITFLMVFLIQNTQNRDSVAVQIKLDELIRSSQAHNALLNLEALDEATMERIRKHYRGLAGKVRAEMDDVEKALAIVGDGD